MQRLRLQALRNQVPAGHPLSGNRHREKRNLLQQEMAMRPEKNRDKSLSKRKRSEQKPGRNLKRLMPQRVGLNADRRKLTERIARLHHRLRRWNMGRRLITGRRRAGCRLPRRLEGDREVGRDEEGRRCGGDD
jgi:hypothetical protein